MIVITAAAKFILAIALLLEVLSVSISLRQITGGMLHDLLKTILPHRSKVSYWV